MANVFLTSDSHFGHANILTFLRTDGKPLRVFPNVHAMDEHMIERWNSVVGPKDKVYHLGDVCMRWQSLPRVMPRLNGRKVLLKGNHDTAELKKYLPWFYDIRAYHRLDKRFLLSHIPLHVSQLARFPVNIHGHLHEKEVCQWPGGPADERYYSVCVERTNYTPVPFDVIQQLHPQG